MSDLERPAAASAARKHSSTWGAVALVVALGLFAFLVYRTGLDTIVGNVRALGWGFVLIFLIQGVRQVIRTLAWYYCIEPAQRTASFLDLCGIRLAGEAITTLTVAGPLVGETAKAVVISRQIPAAHSVPSILVENIIYSLSIALVILAGTMVLVFGFALPESARIAGIAAAAIAVAFVALGAYAFARRWRPLAWMVGAASRRPRVWRWIEAREQKIHAAEAAVHSFFDNRKGLFALVLALELLASVPGVVEAWVILYLTTGHASFAVALVIESVYRIVNTLFSFIPLRLGVDEGGAALVLGALGIGAGEGVSLALIRKARTVLWVALGLAVFARHTLAARKQTSRG